MAAELARLDVFVLASEREGTPNAILEAMAAARPVVASAVVGTSEVVESGRTGLLFPAEDMDAAVNAVISLLDDPRKASTMGIAGREVVLQRYSMDQMVSGTTRMYETLLGRQAAS